MWLRIQARSLSGTAASPSKYKKRMKSKVLRCPGCRTQAPACSQGTPQACSSEGLRAPLLRRPPAAPQREAARRPRDARVLGGKQAPPLKSPRGARMSRVRRRRGVRGRGAPRARGPDHASLSRFLPPLVQAPVSPPPPPPAAAPPPGPRPQPMPARREPLRPGAGLAQA